MNNRDLELLSSYLDGQLKPSDSARLEARLSADPNLRAVLDDLRAARGLLRQLPMRKAPRNFTLTPKMVGKNPPLPRAYPAFRFVTTLASLLLFFTMGLNFLAPQFAAPAFGGFGGGGAPDVFSAQAPAAEAPAAESAATEAPVEEPSILTAPLPTATFDAANSAREMETPSEKNGVTAEDNAADQSQVQNVPPAQGTASQPVAPAWQLALAGIAVFGALIMVVMRKLAEKHWRRS